MNRFERDLFKNSILRIVKMIPSGRATSYGAIAKAVGYPNMSRMVGHILGEDDIHKEIIPAHRVVNSQGRLSGKDAFGKNSEMQRLLESEGITIIDDRIKNWSKIFWNPIVEIIL